MFLGCDRGLPDLRGLRLLGDSRTRHGGGGLGHGLDGRLGGVLDGLGGVGRISFQLLNRNSNFLLNGVGTAGGGDALVGLGGLLEEIVGELVKVHVGVEVRTAWQNFVK